MHVSVSVIDGEFAVRGAVLANHVDHRGANTSPCIAVQSVHIISI